MRSWSLALYCSDGEEAAPKLISFWKECLEVLGRGGRERRRRLYSACWFPHIDESVLPEGGGSGLGLGREGSFAEAAAYALYRSPQLSAEARKEFPKPKSEWL